jgi:6-phosphofructokinase 1
MRAFISYCSVDSDFVLEVAKYLPRYVDDGVFCYEELQRADKSFLQTINNELNACKVVIIFVGEKFTKYQRDEVDSAYHLHQSGDTRDFYICLLEREDLPEELTLLRTFPCRTVTNPNKEEALSVAADIAKKLNRPFFVDGLPLNPHLFVYEKDIINHFKKVNILRSCSFDNEKANELGLSNEDIQEIHKKWLEGCPIKWPKVKCWKDNRTQLGKENYEKWKSEVGEPRNEDAVVVAAALSGYHYTKHNGDNKRELDCMIKQGLHFPEAGPRQFIYFPQEGHILRVAILVSGGIAPGINAVIDGIVQRHHSYAEMGHCKLEVCGLKNGFQAFDHFLGAQVPLDPIFTSSNANEGGSILGTSRVDELLDASKRLEVLESIVAPLYSNHFDILYIIGGDGSMKAAHAIWTFAQEYATKKGNNERKLSVVAIPKTMDNDVLWVWQAFGFCSAVEKAREVIEHLITEVEANPRLCVAQLFGSDSGFVVSHAVLATRTKQCDVALIPEVKFTMKRLAAHMMEKMSGRPELIPRGLVVMAEAAIPLDAMDFINEASPNYIDIDLSESEKEAIRDFDALRNKGLPIQGQTNDALRSAGLKIVSRGLHEILRDPNRRRELKTKIPGQRHQSYWNKLRTFTNEPRHLLRAIPPSCTDIITGNRLGTIAVDNAIAGYTDFMISQWLTEYVLVPLELVILGRKRIPKTGIFWKSTISKTGQPAKLF